MRRQLNIKAAGWFLGVLVLVGAGLASLHSFQVVRHAEVLLRQADKALKENRPENALRYYQLYLTFQPDDVDAAERYGLLQEKYARGPADRDRAAQILEGVLRRDPSRKEARYRLILCLVNLFRFNEARAHAEKLRPVWDRKGEMEHILGWCCEADKQYDKAAEWFRQAIALDPGRIESYVLLAGVLQQRSEDRDKAAEVMDELVKANPGSYQAYLYRRQFLLQSKDGIEPRPDLAQKDLQKALDLAPNEPDVVLAAADSAQKQGKTDEARALLNRGLDAHPDQEVLYRVLAELEMAAGKPGSARTVLERGVQKVPQAWELLVLLTDLLIDQKDLPAAEQRLAELKPFPAASSMADYFQARLLIENRRWSDAIPILERLRGELPPGHSWAVRINVQLGWCYRQIGDAEQQLLAFGRAQSQDPNLLIARWGHGSALLTLGRLEEALQFLQEATGEAVKGPRTIDVPPEAWLDLVRCLMLRNLRLPEDRRDWAKVKEALEQTLKAQKRIVETVILQAEVEAAQKNFATARSLLEKGRAEFPGSVRLECALSDLAVMQLDFAGALAVLDRAQSKFGPSFELSEARLRLWSRQRGTRAREEMLALADSLQALSSAERAQFLRDLAEAWLRLGDLRAAESVWRRLIQEQPADLRARLALLEVSLLTNNLDGARQVVNDLRKLEGQRGVTWHYGAAALLLAEAQAGGGKLDQAREHLAACYRSRGDWSKLPLLEARIDEAEGKFDKAIEHYGKAFDRGERAPNLVYRLLKLLQEKREFGLAEKVLGTYEVQVPLLPELAKLGADLALANNSIHRALELAPLAIPKNSRDYRDYLWLARIYRDDKGEQGKSVGKLLDEAVKLAPYAPETWVAKVEHLARNGQLESVPSALTQMKKLTPPERQPITLARSNEVLGRFDQAETNFREALALNPRDFVLQAGIADFFRNSDQPDKAVPFLEKLLEPGSLAPPEFQFEARRHLALILASKGQSTDVKHGLDVLDAGPHIAPAYDRIRALVQGFDPSQRDQALKTFNTLRANRSATPEELFILATIYAVADQPNQARDVLRELVSISPDNPQYLARYIHSLLEVDPNGARIYFEALERREPDSPRTRNLKPLITKAL